MFDPSPDLVELFRRRLAGEVERARACLEGTPEGLAAPYPVPVHDMAPAWPWPATLRDALDLAAQDDELPARAAADLRWCLDVLPPELRTAAATLPQVVGAWPWLWGTQRMGAELLWRCERAIALAGAPADLDARTRAAMVGPFPAWPSHARPLIVARWAQAWLNRADVLDGDAGDVLVQAAEKYELLTPDEKLHRPLTTLEVIPRFTGGQGRRVPFLGLVLLYEAERTLRPELVAWDLMAALDTADPGPALQALARDAAGDDAGAVDALARALVDALRRLRVDLKMDGTPPSYTDARRGRDGMLWLDAAAADALEAVGAEGKATAAELRTNARARWLDFTGGPDSTATVPGVAASTPADLWRLWLPAPDVDGPAHGASRFARELAAVLWLDVVKQRQRKPPALVLPLFDQAARALTPGGRADEQPDGQLLLLDRRGVVIVPLYRDVALPVPVTSMAAVAALAVSGAELLGTLTSQRLFRWIVREVHARAVAGDPDARLLVIEGGFRELAHRVGAGAGARDELRQIVTAMAHLHFPLPGGGGGNLLAYADWPARGQRPARLELQPGPLLFPSFGADLPAGQRARVPVLDVPPMVGAARLHAPQAALQLHALAELRRHARDLVEHGGARLPWEHLAELAGLPADWLARVLARWTQDGDDGPAFLKRVDRDRYTLGDAHKAARDYMEDGWRYERDGAAAGRLGAERKRAKLARLGAPKK